MTRITTEEAISSSESSMASESSLKNTKESIGPETFSTNGRSTVIKWRQNPMEVDIPSPRSIAITRKQIEKIPLSTRLNSSYDENASVNDFIDITKLSTKKLIKMISTILEKLIKSNDELRERNETSLNDRTDDDNSDESKLVRSIKSFRGKHIPPIKLEQYFHRIQKYCPTNNLVLLAILIYFDRISKVLNGSKENESDPNISTHHHLLRNYDCKIEDKFLLDSYNIHRLIISAITVSTKFWSDFFYSNSRYAKVGGISLDEMNYLELQFLLISNFDLIISSEEIQRYSGLLSKFYISITDLTAS